MDKDDQDRVVFHSKYDMASTYHLSKAENILKQSYKESLDDINDVIELYNIKCYIDNEVYLNNWTRVEIEKFKKRVKEYGRIIGKFISGINDNNLLNHHEKLIFQYTESFWLLINNQKVFKNISPVKIEEILSQKPHEIRIILRHKGLVERYDHVLHDFLLSYNESAEILLSIYEVEKAVNHADLFVPKSLTTEEKEKIISDYIDSEICSINYLPIIQNSKRNTDFRISDKTRLKAKRKNQEETNKFFDEKSINSSMKYGVSISYPEDASEIKEVKFEGSIVHYAYSLDFIKNNTQSYPLYLNFKLLFEYLDHQNRINLINKSSQVSIMEGLIGVRSKNEYFCGFAFRQSEMAAQAQIFTYSNVLTTLDSSLEEILQFVFTSFFTKEYGFANNATLTMPTANATALEKVRLLAPELESVFKQYKLFVDDNEIDFELLQMSSSPSSIKDIPSLNENKYIYPNKDNTEFSSCTHLLFSDQTLLAYVEPFKEESYHSFFELLINENDIFFTNYEKHQVANLNYLIEKECITIGYDDRVKVNNLNRVLILEDLHENEVASFYHYPTKVQEEITIMAEEGLIYFESSLMSKPEQDYFNYYLNKSEFTNGLDLRNSYLHGTQANPSEKDLHEHSYLIYLKLLTLLLFKIEDDLQIKHANFD